MKHGISSIVFYVEVTTASNEWDKVMLYMKEELKRNTLNNVYIDLFSASGVLTH